MAGSAATILHADLDACYASVEQLLDARLRGKPDDHGPRALRRLALGHALADAAGAGVSNEGAR